MSDDLISRKAAIDKAIMIPVARIVTEDKVLWRKAVFVEDIEALPSAQSGVPDTNVGDMISRADAIKAICEDGTALERQGRYSLTMAERKQRDADILEALPSAQETHEERTETHACDLISRADAIKTAHFPVIDDASYEVVRVDDILALPSAQQKTLKYSGDSICLYCMTGDCVGCIYEPMEGVMNE